MENIIKKIKETYFKYFYTFPSSFEEFREINVYNNFRIFELFNKNSDIQEIISDIENSLGNDKAFKNKMNIIVADKVISFLSDSHRFMLSAISTLSDASKQKKLFLDILGQKIKYLKEISIEPLNEKDLKEIIQNLLEENKQELERLIKKLNINLKGYYNANLLAIYSLSFQHLDKLNEDNLYLVAILNDLLIYFEIENSKFNGVENNKLNSQFKNLVQLFKNKKNYDLSQEEQFSKYGLIEINEHRELLEEEPRIIDTKYGISMDIKYIHSQIYRILFDLYTNNSLQLSFYPNCNGVYDFENRLILILEELQFGVAPSISDLKNKVVEQKAKFIDFEEKDSLYIRLNGNELTFEEISDDFEIFEDSIITKVIHLEFFEKEDELFIKHIDLEYIFYTSEEFIERYEHNNFYQKGQAFPRQKVFKLDNGEINLNEFLYPLAYYSFKNKTLVDEYFTKIGLIK